MDKIKEDKKPRKRVLKDVDLERIPINRKLIAWVFIGTGIISLFLWLRGKGEIKPFNFFEQKLTFDLGTKTNSPTPVAKKESFKVKGEISELVATASGSYSVYVSRIKSGVVYGVNEKEEMEGASIMKVPVLITALRMNTDGMFPFEKELAFTLTESDRTPGSGPLQFLPAGSKIDGERLLLELGKKSDNTAWVMLNRIIGKDYIQMQIDKMGMANTDYKNLTTTAEDVGKMFMKIYDRNYFSGVTRIEKYLTDSIYEDRIPVGITDDNVKIIHKVGTLDGVWTDAGIVECAKSDGDLCTWEPFVLVIMNKGVKRSEAERIVPEIAKRIWEYEISDKRL